jgi:hypothetical protein
VYGNAYFHSAFISNNQYDDLKFALNSYNQSEKYHENTYKNTDLYYNRGIVHSYLVNYNEAYSDFTSAHLIDENLKADNLASNTLESVTQIYKLIKNKCTIKPKKLSQILNTIPTNLKENINFSLTKLDELVLGENKNKIISAKGVQAVKKVFEVPL